MACEEKPDGTLCPETTDTSCRPFQLTKSKDNCFIDQVVNESLGIGGADIHVFKLLGVHEQGLLVDLTGNGATLSNGDAVNFPASNAFDMFTTEWRSLQQGSAVVTSAYIGYNFGEIKLDNNRVRYGIETHIRHNIATIKIKQSSDATKRVTKARVERSEDGIKWYGAAIVTLPDDDVLNTISFDHSVSSGYWRLRPLEFNGGPSDFWAVQALQLIDYDETSINDIQDDIFQENRDRDYATESITLKGAYDLIDIQTELTRFGIELPTQSYYIQMSFSDSVTRLGRPIVIGDIFEVPSEVQYSPSMTPIKKYLEVTDVGWSTEGYAPGWTPTMVRIVAQPMIASQETQDIFGGLAGKSDALGLFDMNDGSHPIFQDISEVPQAIQAEALDDTPERGRDYADIHQFTDEQIEYAATEGVDLQKISLNSTALYVEDGLPPNGADFTTGDTLPENPTDGDYHRLTYSGLADNIPARLFRYSLAKARWLYLETDRRTQYSATRPTLQEYLSSPTRIAPGEVEK